MGKEREEKEKKKKKGRKACCSREGLRKGSWTPEEDNILVDFITKNGHGTWRNLPKLAGLLRCGKSCRLRWTNYLRPDIKRGPFSPDEETQIIHLQRMLGNKWAAIASHLPGRTDNDVKNFWNSHLRKRFALDQPSSSLPAPSDTPKSRGDYFLNLWNSNIGESFRNVNEGARPASHSTTSSSLTEQKGEVVIKCKKEVEDSYDMDDSSEDGMMKLLLLDFPVGDNDMGFLGSTTADHGSTYI